MESVRAKHAAELEAKRKKLEEIRKRKASVRAEESGAGAGAAVGAVSETVTRAVDEQENKFDDFIQNILKSTGAGDADSNSAGAAAADPQGARAQPGATLSLAEKLSKLSTVTNVAETHIQPTLVETYTKYTETDITLEHEIVVRDTGVGDMDVDFSSSPAKTHESASASTTASPGSPRRTLMVDTEMAVTEDAAVATLTPDERKQLLQSEAMETFLTRASRIIERALTSTSKFDVMVDYGATVETDLLTEDTVEALKAQVAFADDKWTAHRAVTDVDISPFYPELLLVAYTARDYLDEDDRDISTTKAWDTMGNSAASAAASAAAMSDASAITDGVVLLWSTALPTRPEYKFTCHSQVTTACFNPFDRHVIFGGTYSGQIVVWDTRAKAAPVQKTSLSACCHTHPIYSMTVIGSKSAYHLVSASTDGRICVWDVDQLQQPVDMLDLRIALSIVSNYTTVNISTDKKMEAAVTAFALQRKESNELFLGTEAGKLYTTTLEPHKTKTGAAADASALDADKQAKSGFSAAGVAREVIVTPVAKDGAHFGPVTAMHFNPVLPGHRDGLLLTSSLDSMVKLWSTEHPHEPVFAFEPSSEYICDVRWSATHPALFAVADGSGAVSIWNILRDVEVPVVEAKIGDKALNKIRWSADGKSLVIGDADGKTHVYDIPSEIATPQPDDLTLLEAKVAAALAAAAIAKA